MNIPRESAKQILQCGATVVVTLVALVSVTAQQSEDSSPPANQAAVAPAAEAVPPPSAPPQRSAADLEKLVEPIALYPDPLIAVMLPASVYPVEIVQAARFVADTNNLAKLDEQPWDDSVKAVARVPAAIKKMNDELGWTVELGQAFLAQPEELMDAIQFLRKKADAAGTLRTTEQQIVVVTNAVVERTYESQIVYVTNTVVQIVPANPQIIYVPTYNPTVVYYPPPTYVYNPYSPLITFGAGVAVGAIIANNSCNWHYGYVHCCGSTTVKIKYEGGYYPPPPGYRPPPYHPPPGYRPPPPGYRPPGVPPPGARPPGGVPPRASTMERWQPDQTRLRTSTGPSSPPSVNSLEARGWGSGTGTPTARPTLSTGTAGNRPSTGTVPSGNRPTAGRSPEVIRGTPSSTPSVRRPGGAPSTSHGQSVTRPSTTAGSARATPSQGAYSRPASSTGGRNNAFGGVGSGASARQSSSRGSMSRGGGGMSRGGGARGGGRR
jgi:hypothetical protein